MLRQSFQGRKTWKIFVFLVCTSSFLLDFSLTAQKKNTKIQLNRSKSTSHQAIVSAFIHFKGQEFRLHHQHYFELSSVCLAESFSKSWLWLKTRRPTIVTHTEDTKEHTAKMFTALASGYFRDLREGGRERERARERERERDSNTHARSHVKLDPLRANQFHPSRSF